MPDTAPRNERMPQAGPLSRDRGQALVELALLLPVFGWPGVDRGGFGDLYADLYRVSNAAREGAYYAAERLSDAPLIRLASTPA